MLMSTSSEEKIGLILGKLEGLTDYTKEMNHSLRDEFGKVTLSIEDLRDHVNKEDEALDTRVTELEKSKNSIETVVKTIKWMWAALGAGVIYFLQKLKGGV